MTTEFLHEQHAHKDHYAFAKLSRDVSRDRIHELFAGMTQKSVTFTKLRSDGNNTSFKLTADEAQTFVTAWLDFQMANSAYEIEEQLRKEQEELQEAERRGKVWLEVDELAHSIPGIEITARTETVYDYDSDDGSYKEVQRWSVKLAAPYYNYTVLYYVDEVLDSVKEAIKSYNRHLENCEASEAANFYGYNERSRQDTIEFLAAHRAFIAKKETEQEVVNAVQHNS